MNVNSIEKYFNSAIRVVRKIITTPKIKHEQNLTQDVFVRAKRKVNKVSNKLLVGENPTFLELLQIKSKKNITLIIDVRSKGSAFLEKIICKLLRIKYKNIPITFKHDIKDAKLNLEKMSNTIKNNTLGYIFVHCKLSRHRSVLACAYHKIAIGEIKTQKDLMNFLKANRYFVVTPRKDIGFFIHTLIKGKPTREQMRARRRSIIDLAKNFANAFLPQK